LLTSIIVIFGNLAFPLVTILIYNTGSSFPNWNLWEVLLIQSLFTLSTSFTSIFLGGTLWETMNYVREGNFEIVLLKPINSLFYIVSSTFSIHNIGLLLSCLAIFIIALINTGIYSLMSIIWSLIIFTGGICVMIGVYLIMAAISFKWVGNSRIPEIFGSIQSFGKYPLTIFPAILQGIVTFILPVGMIAFYPAAALLGRVDLKIIIAIVPCILFMLFGIWLYRHMIRLYEGVGG
ncbi:MAG: hypothetical protein GX896_00200, partial [Clostridiales bacterium]|nr:hypothetical protein [Clostridiales bacterium]